jgi:hypothetical protein
MEQYSLLVEENLKLSHKFIDKCGRYDWQNKKERRKLAINNMSNRYQ